MPKERNPERFNEEKKINILLFHTEIHFTVLKAISNVSKQFIGYKNFSWNDIAIEIKCLQMAANISSKHLLGIDLCFVSLNMNLTRLRQTIKKSLEVLVKQDCPYE